MLFSKTTLNLDNKRFNRTNLGSYRQKYFIHPFLIMISGIYNTPPDRAIFLVGKLKILYNRRHTVVPYMSRIQVQPETAEFLAAQEEYVSFLTVRVLERLQKAKGMVARVDEGHIISCINTPSTETSLALNQKVTNSTAVKERIAALNQQYTSVFFYVGAYDDGLRIYVDSRKKKCVIQ